MKSGGVVGDGESAKVAPQHSFQTRQPVTPLIQQGENHRDRNESSSVRTERRTITSNWKSGRWLRGETSIRRRSETKEPSNT